MIASIELDIYSEETDATLLFAEAEQWVDDKDVTFVLVDPAGPAGGNPVFRFTAELDKLFELCLKYHMHDYEDTVDVFFASIFDVVE